MYYKLTNKKWALNEWHEIPAEKRGKGFCTGSYFRLHDDPLLAVLLNPICADFKGFRMFEAETEGPVESDKGLKFGAVKMRLVREIDAPALTAEQRVRFAILCAVEVHNEAGFNTWAQDWLSGKDRTAEAAWKAATWEAVTWEAVVWEAAAWEAAAAAGTAWEEAAAATWAAAAATWATAVASRAAARAAAAARAEATWATRAAAWEAAAAATWAGWAAANVLDFKALAAKAIKENEARK